MFVAPKYGNIIAVIIGVGISLTPLEFRPQIAASILKVVLLVIISQLLARLRQGWFGYITLFFFSGCCCLWRLLWILQNSTTQICQEIQGCGFQPKIYGLVSCLDIRDDRPRTGGRFDHVPYTVYEETRTTTLFQSQYSLRVGMFALPPSRISFLLQVFQHISRCSATNTKQP